MQISVRSNIDSLARRIKSYRDQIPQATAMALNATAFDFRKEIVTNTWPRSVIVRNRGFMNAALRVETAKKRNLTVTVYDQLKREYLSRLDKSGVKIPLGNHLAIPGREVKSQIRGGNGAIKKNYKPRALLTKKRYFVQTLKTGVDAILERPVGREKGLRKKTRQKRGPLKVWYILEPRANIPSMFPFYETANRIVERRIGINFRNAFRRAVMTRR